MKKRTVLLIAFVLCFSCQHKTEPVDLEAAKKEVTETMEKFNAANMARDIDAVASFISEDALLCGTDKSEFWNKTQGVDIMSETMSNEDISMDYSIDKREIRIGPDGKTALVIEQYFMADMFGPNLPLRSISHFVKTENGWMMDFFSWNVIPDNEDLEKIITALEK
jgi:ketosteroid isomerase-like protein